MHITRADFGPDQHQRDNSQANNGTGVGCELLVSVSRVDKVRE